MSATRTLIIVGLVVLLVVAGVYVLTVGVPAMLRSSYITSGRAERWLHKGAPVDLQRYAGTWYEIASAPAPFQKDCVCTTATYTIEQDSTVGVLNECTRGQGQAPSVAKAVAWPYNARNTWLNVNFTGRRTWPWSVATGAYWIVHVDTQQYRESVVASPDGKYLWILSRTPDMSDERLGELLGIAAAKGIPTATVRRTCVERKV